MRYINYHRHSMYSNLRSLDCVVKPEDYMKRAVELGQKEYVTTEHGFQGNIFEAYTLCQQYGLKCIYGVEAYYADNAEDKSERSAFHIMLVALTEKARREINAIMSWANTNGFYYKPRIGLKQLLSLTPTDTLVTTACIAGRMFKDGWKEKFFEPVYKHFGSNFYLEVQSHVNLRQAEYNRKLVELHRATGIPLIHANDSHYIFPEDAKYRDLFLKAKGIEYEDERGFILDYPDSETILARYKEQGVLTEEEAIEALNNTLVIDKAEGIHLDKEFKIPKIVDGDSNKVLQSLINEGWKKERVNIPKEKWPEYLAQIKYEYKIVEDCGMADYFILDHYVVKRAVEKYDAILTRTGRGSAVSFYINKLLGLTEVDRIAAPITLYPTRFMSAERILNSRSLPDIDLNWASVKPVIQASKDILGQDGIYYMIAYKPLQESSAFRLWCKAIGMAIGEYDDIAKNIDDYIDNTKWGPIIEQSKVFRGVIESVAPSPCSFLLSNDKISEMIGLIKVGDEICCCLDGYNCDAYKYLKNDYLTVSVYELIDRVYKLIGRPIDNIDTLIKNCDQKVWDIYAKGLTTTINQADSDYDKQILSKYKPKNLSELSAYVAAIRPGFSSLLNNFVERKPYTTGVAELDDILKDSFHYLMYQESIMKYLVWLGVEEKGTYDIIKKIAKKKFKEDELEALKNRLINAWEEKLGTKNGFAETWQVIEDAVRYSFNASHSLSVALDSMYGAYLKSHYPLEYFTVALTMYTGDMERTANLIAELPYFGIELRPIRYGHSKADYNLDKETNSIYKGVESLLYLDADTANKLYELSQTKTYNSFLELLADFPGDSRQLDILIRLNYFDMFGTPGQLLALVEAYNKWGGRKTLSKDMDGLPTSEVMSQFAIETAKQYKLTDSQGFLAYMCGSVEPKPFTLSDELNAQIEFQGYCSTKIPSKRNWAYITAVDTKYSPKITIYCLDTGVTKTVKMYKKQYQMNPVEKGMIITYGLTSKQKSRLNPETKEWQKIPGEYEDFFDWYSIREGA